MAVNKFVPCADCTNGYIIDNGDACKCDCLLEFQKKNRSFIAFKNSNINSFLYDYEIEDYIGRDVAENLEKIKKFINFFEEKYNNQHLYLYGPNHTQKTTIASYIGKKLIQKKYKVYLVILNDFIRSLTQRDFEAEQHNYAIKKTVEADLLIVDDSFCTQKNTVYASGYQIPFLDTFLRDRLEGKRKATIFTSNISRENIDENVFGMSIKSLIMRSTHPLHFVDNVAEKNNFEGSIWE